MFPRGRQYRVGAAVAVFVAAVGIASAIPELERPASAQEVVEPAELGQEVFLRPPRELLQSLAAARSLLDAQRYDEAVGVLGSILDSPRDYFYQPDRQGAPELHRSLKDEVQRWIGEMPRRGRDLYQLRFGAVAQHALDRAVQTGDAGRLAEVSRRFFHTQAGYEATLLLGIDHFNHARPLAAALMLDRLRQSADRSERFEPTLSLTLAAAWVRSGMPDKAREVLSALRAQQRVGAVAVAGRAAEIPDGSDELLAWIEDLAERTTGAKTSPLFRTAMPASVVAADFGPASTRCRMASAASMLRASLLWKRTPLSGFGPSSASAPAPGDVPT